MNKTLAPVGINVASGNQIAATDHEQMKRVRTRIIGHLIGDETRYVLLPEDSGQIELVPCKIFHRCVFPDDILSDDGLLRDGTLLRTVRMAESGKLYPDHSLYRPGLPPQESKTCEFKSSFLHPASRSDSSTEQVDEIAATLAGFSNARIKNGILYVGVGPGGMVTDNIEKEVKDDAVEFEADYRNRLSQALSSASYAANYLTFSWEKLRGKRYCRINARPYPEILFVRGNQLYVRSQGAATIKLVNNDLITFVKQWK